MPLNDPLHGGETDAPARDSTRDRVNFTALSLHALLKPGVELLGLVFRLPANSYIAEGVRRDGARFPVEVNRSFINTRKGPDGDRFRQLWTAQPEN
jgi:hypothetical protein